MRKGAYKPGAYVSPPSSHRNHRQGRGGGGAGGSGGKTNGIMLSKIFFGFVGLVATMLPARVAGQSMTCNSRYEFQRDEFQFKYIKNTHIFLSQPVIRDLYSGDGEPLHI